ncbi:hypothetical protein HY251_11795 [bacterium]|nr:hypothetical protein [bacterium]
MRALEKVQIRNEVEHVVNIPSSAMIAGILSLVGFSFAERVLPVPPSDLASDIHEQARIATAAAGAGTSTILVGMLVMLGRQKIVTKVVGLLLMENGVILAILGLTHGMPLLVEFGIALDVFVAVQILAIFTLRLRGGVEPGEHT